MLLAMHFTVSEITVYVYASVVAYLDKIHLFTKLKCSYFVKHKTLPKLHICQMKVLPVC